MSEARDIDGPIATLRAAASLIERTFLPVGFGLEAASGLLANLLARTDTVLRALQGDELAGALAALSKAAVEVAGLAQSPGEGAPGDEAAPFDALRQQIAAIAVRLQRIGKQARQLDPLIVSARIAGAVIDLPGVDFSGFADDIAATLATSLASVDRFGAELDLVGQRIEEAAAKARAFRQRRDVAGRTIAPRLSDCVRSVAEQHRRAGEASAELRHGTRQVHQQVGFAILGLQIGDATRQRLEHAEAALALLRSGRAGDTPAAVDLVGQLVLAQVGGAAADFARGATGSLAAFEGLRDAAGVLGRLSRAACGGDDGGRDSIAGVEAQVGAAGVLFADFVAARSDLEAMFAAAIDAAASLGGHLRHVLSLETDVRIMSLNTTFKCARIGSAGVTLGVIAQELRAYASRFAGEANSMLAEVGGIATLTEQRRSAGDAGVTAVIDRVTGVMSHAVAILGDVGHLLQSTLTVLDEDWAKVTTVLASTTVALATHDQVSRLLEAAAADMRGLFAPCQRPTGDLPDEVAAVLEQIARGYTMREERLIHDEALGRAQAAPPVAAALEDMLF